MSDTTRSPVPASGGPSLRRALAKEWGHTIVDRVAVPVTEARARDRLGRSVLVACAGPEAATWAAWHRGREGIMATDQLSPDDPCDVLLAVDHLGHRGAAETQQVAGGMLAATRVGGRMVVVDRVVTTTGHVTMHIDALLAILMEVAGTALVLEDVRSLRRPGETVRSSAVLQFVKLGPLESA